VPAAASHRSQAQNHHLSHDNPTPDLRPGTQAHGLHLMQPNDHGRLFHGQESITMAISQSQNSAIAHFPNSQGLPQVPQMMQPENNFQSGMLNNVFTGSAAALPQIFAKDFEQTNVVNATPSQEPEFTDDFSDLIDWDGNLTS